jgi:NDP-sugar pyrophosphorylase family protein
MANRSKASQGNGALTAVIIADTFTNELQPLTQSRPRALLPVANVPLIEYLLESLVYNGIREVRIASYYCADELQQHLETAVTYTGKSWLDSAEISVRMVRGQGGVSSVCEALRDLLHRNQLPEKFILIPVDTLTSCSNLAEMCRTHRERSAANSKILFSACMLEHATHLDDIQRAINREHIDCSDGAVAAGTGKQCMTPNTTVSMPSFSGGAAGNAFADHLAPLSNSTRTSTALEYVTVAFDHNRQNFVSSYQSWSENEQVMLRNARAKSGSQLTTLDDTVGLMQECTTVDVNVGADVTVRTDVVNTGIYICNLTLVVDLLQQEITLRDFNDIMRYVVDNPEVCFYRFAVDYLRTATPSPHHRHPAHLPHTTLGKALVVPPTVLPIRSIASYVAANIGVMARRIFPMTRDNNFAEDGDHTCYKVWPHCASVYLHNKINQRIGSSTSVGPHVAVGEGAQIAVGPHETGGVVISNSSIGNHVTIGDGCVVINSIIMDNVTIGRNVVIKDSVIGNGVEVKQGSAYARQLQDVVLGDGVVLGEDAGPTQPGTRLHYNTHQAKTAASEVAVGRSGRGFVHPKTGPSCLALRENETDLKALFVRDVEVAARSDDEDSEEDVDPQEALFEAVLSDMGDAVERADFITSSGLRSWKQLMLSYQRSFDDLLCAIVRALLVFMARKRGGDGAKVACKAVTSTLSAWGLPLFRVVMRPSGVDRTFDMHGVLRGFAQAMASPETEVLHPKAATILSCLYAGTKAEADVLERDGYFIVNYESVMAFDDFITAGGGGMSINGLPEEDVRAIEKGWTAVGGYVAQLRDLE